MEINKEILRWVILIGATPIWLPFLLNLWRDFNDALREDGGLLGGTPSPRELERIRREKEKRPDILVSEPIVRPGEQKRPRMATSARSAPAATRPPPGFRGGSTR